MPRQSNIYSNSELISQSDRYLGKLPRIIRQSKTYFNSDLISKTERKLGEMPRIKRKAIVYLNSANNHPPVNIILQIIKQGSRE